MIILSLGSNLSSSFGDRFENIDLAIKYLLNKQIKLIKRSSFYETPSYPNKKDPKFINAVIEVESKLKPEILAGFLLDAESSLERIRNVKNQPRTCDIDIIDYNGKNLSFDHKNCSFVVPHIRLGERNFVLYPLKEIIPNWVHPISNVHIDTLIKNLRNEDKNSILKIKKS
tara:strand:+ start:393 stop:905 length:513 start_codon:yes stop_codon:yes gene_type:complete